MVRLFAVHARNFPLEHVFALLNNVGDPASNEKGTNISTRYGFLNLLFISIAS
jgi:hypothetical protein